MTTKRETLEQKDQNGSEALWKSYQEYTEGLSVNGRKLAFAAAGICWILKTDLLPNLVLIALLFVSLFFVFDILQYLIAAILLRFWLRTKEKEFQKQNGTLKGDYSAPASLDKIPFIFWIAKIICLISSYILIGGYVLFFSGLTSFS